MKLKPGDKTTAQEELTMAQLFERIRTEWAADDTWRTNDFRTFIRGGVWAIAHKGQPHNEVGAELKGGVPTDFAIIHGLPQMNTFVCKEHQEGCEMMAVEFCR